MLRCITRGRGYRCREVKAVRVAAGVFQKRPNASHTYPLATRKVPNCCASHCSTMQSCHPYYNSPLPPNMKRSRPAHVQVLVGDISDEGEACPPYRGQGSSAIILKLSALIAFHIKERVRTNCSKRSPLNPTLNPKPTGLLLGNLNEVTI